MEPEKECDRKDNDGFSIEGEENFCDGGDGSKKASQSGETIRANMAYCVTDVPPWYWCIIFGIQHCLTAFGSLIAIPLVISQGLCLQHDGSTQSHLISTTLFVAGMCTLLQVSFGVRLPILQGGSFSLLAPSLALLSTPKWTCPAWTQNASLVNSSSPIFIEVWQSRMKELQGSILVASCFQILLGFSGLVGFLMRFIGPLTIAPTISLIGLSLFDPAGSNAGDHWGISFMTMVLIILFSQYLGHLRIPIPTYSKAKKIQTSNIRLFQVLPVLLGITISWLFCYLLTIYDILPPDPMKYGFLARTDLKGDVVSQTPWFRFPYPGQWGVPTVSFAGVCGILAGVTASVIESIGDYHTCAKLSGSPPPPRHAINRGVGIEGVGCLLAGAWGTGNGTTSYGENVGVLSITKVGSRAVIMTSGILMIILGLFGKLGAIFTTIPTPVVGGMLLVMFGVVSAAGVSNLQYTDMNSSRNIFIFGFSVLSGLAIPNWIKKNPAAIATGVVEVDQVVHILLTTGMFVGGFIGFVFDNTIPGSVAERGIAAWNNIYQEESSELSETEDVYGLPLGLGSVTSSWVHRLPFWPPRSTRAQQQVQSDLGLVGGAEAVGMLDTSQAVVEMAS